LKNKNLDWLRTIYQIGAWLFNHSGPLAPRLARWGYPLSSYLFRLPFLGKKPNPVLVNDFYIYHRGIDSYHMQLLAMGMHDRDVDLLLRKTVTTGMTIVDVGAHLGYFSLLSAYLSGPHGTVWAIEPLPQIVELLRLNIEANGYSQQIHVINTAVGNSNGKALFYVGLADAMLSSLWQDAALTVEYLRNRSGNPRYSSELVDCIEVECTTLDTWAAARNWPIVDLVKMDIEGAEIAALEGMREVKRRNPGLKLITELNIRTLQITGATIEDFWSALQSCGFNSFWMAGRNLVHVEFPSDWSRIQQEIRRLGNDRVNLLCETIED
jgi:FkbM family methyltransferase